MNRAEPSSRAGPKIKPTTRPFFKRAWAGLGLLWLEPGLARSGLSRALANWAVGFLETASGEVRI